MDKLMRLGDFFGVSLDFLAGNEAEAEGGACCVRGWYHEYRSVRTIGGLPLVHINIGRNCRRAKGIIAVGNIAQGIVAVGMLSMGVASLGALSAGLLSVGGLALGLLLAIGGGAAGGIAIGGLAVGVFAVGGCAVGVYALGGGAFAAKIAAGGYASAPVAIGDQTRAQVSFCMDRPIAPGAVRKAILEKYPQTWDWIIRLFDAFGS